MSTAEAPPQSGGMLDLTHFRDWQTGEHLGGLATCNACGWEGAPTFHHGKASTHCPKCEERAITEEVLAQVDAERGPRHVESTPGRNDPCSCGSGRKFKKCCG